MTQHLDRDDIESVVSLLFDSGERPFAAAISALAERNGQFSVSIDPGNGVEYAEADLRWVELLANGLTFDLVGLQPGRALTPQPVEHRFGLPADMDCTGLEALAILPGPHLASGRLMVPVVRSLAALAGQLAELEGLRAIAWNPAGTCCSPDYFRDSVNRWIEGGAFPGLGLTSLVPMVDGSLRSMGLELFTGQELSLSPELASDRAEGAKVALRLLHWLVENGTLEQTAALTGPAGETLVLEPDENHAIVKVWSGAR